MSLDTTGYDVLALTCADERCPTLYRDPTTGRIGVRGYNSSTEQHDESIVWMDPEQWAIMRAV